MAYVNGPQAITSGLVLYLDAANQKSYSGSGTTWADLSGNNYTNTLRNSPTFSGDNGGSITFNGSTQYTDSSVGLINPTTNWTVNVWYKTAGSSILGPLLVRGNLAETYQWRCELESTGKIRFLMRNPSDQSVLGLSLIHI